MMKTSVGICLVPSRVVAHAASALMPLPPVPAPVVPVVMMMPVVELVVPVIMPAPPVVVVAALPPPAPDEVVAPVVVVEWAPEVNVDSPPFFAAHPHSNAAKMASDQHERVKVG